MRIARVFALSALLTSVAMPVLSATTSSGDPRQTSSPPARCCFGMARNPGGGVMMFGGEGPGGVIGDTWTWDGRSWTEQHPAHSPEPRSAFSLVYDPVSDHVVLFGGGTGEVLLRDTWTWNGSDWTRQRPLQRPPLACCYGMAFDKATQRVILLIALPRETWAWDGSQWTKLAPSHAPSSRDSASQTARDGDHIVMFGGTICPDDLCTQFLRDTWTWNGTTWQKQAPDTFPRGRFGGAMAYDQATGTTVLFGGESRHGFLDETWEWDGVTWTRLNPSDSPSARYGVRMSYDGARHELVLFGGNGPFSYLGDTWTWDGVTWTEE